MFDMRKREGYMEAVIKKISEIETAAKRIMENAHNQLDVLKEHMDEKTATFNAQVKADTEKNLDTLRQDLQAKTDATLAKLKSDTARNLDALDKYYAEHHNQLSECVYQKIIGV